MMLDHGITEKIIRLNAPMVIARTHFWVPVIRCSVPSGSCSRSSAIRSVVDTSSAAGSSQPTRESPGSLRTFAAYRSTQATDIAVSTTHSSARRTMPSPIETLASPAATPIGERVHRRTHHAGERTQDDHRRR